MEVPYISKIIKVHSPQNQDSLKKGRYHGISWPWPSLGHPRREAAQEPLELRPTAPPGRAAGVAAGRAMALLAAAAPRAPSPEEKAQWRAAGGNVTYPLVI